MVGRGTTRIQAARHWAVAAVLLLTLSGCAAQAGTGTSSSADAGSSSAASATGGSAMGSASPTDSGSPTGEAGVAVALGSTSLGDVLVDGAGRTLYMFDKDTQGGPSTCYDQCASAWPPLLADGTPGAGAGVDGARLGTSERTDGSAQVTYDGWPLYYWAQDAKPGDVNGQGVNGVWWVLGADGAPIHG